MEPAFEMTLGWPIPAVFPLIAGGADDGDHPVPRPAKKKARQKGRTRQKESPS